MTLFSHILLASMMNRRKQKYTKISVKEKANIVNCKVGMSNKEIAKKCAVPKNTFSTWGKKGKNKNGSKQQNF